MYIRLLAAIGLLAALLAACSSLVPPPKPTLSPLVIRGRQVFDSYCSRCHDLAGEAVIVGPSLAGVAGRAEERVPGLDAEGYIRTSILNPSAYVVDGFPDGTMPQTFREDLAPDDLEAVVAFLLTLNSTE